MDFVSEQVRKACDASINRETSGVFFFQFHLFNSVKLRFEFFDQPRMRKA